MGALSASVLTAPLPAATSGCLPLGALRQRPGDALWAPRAERSWCGNIPGPCDPVETCRLHIGPGPRRLPTGLQHSWLEETPLVCLHIRPRPPSSTEWQVGG